MHSLFQTKGTNFVVLGRVGRVLCFVVCCIWYLFSFAVGLVCFCLVVPHPSGEVAPQLADVTLFLEYSKKELESKFLIDPFPSRKRVSSRERELKPCFAFNCF